MVGRVLSGNGHKRGNFLEWVQYFIYRWKFELYGSIHLAEEPEIKWPIFAVSSESSRKTPISALLTTPKSLTVWITTNCGKFFKRWEYQTALPASWEICMQVKKQQLEPDMEQWTGSKSVKEYVKAVYCHPDYLTSMQSTSCKMPGWMKNSWHQDCWEKYQ